MSAHGESFQRGILFPKIGRQERVASFESMGVSPPSTEVPVGRFGRIFEGLAFYEPSNGALKLLAETMEEAEVGDDSPIPLGFAFLGQFIDHDITFDPISRLDERLDPQAIRNFRTPTLDLDSVYGDGPDTSRHLYDTQGKLPGGSEHRLPFRLLTGTEKNEGDLPRNRQGAALIGDPRNDENLLVSQVHRAFLGFHNRVVQFIEKEREDAGLSPLANKDLFEEARRIVTLHYHWIVEHEFLPHIVGAEMTEEVVVNGRKFFKWEENSRRPFIPVEFSGAAYRFGHTLIRANYALNDAKTDIELFKLPFFGTCPLGDCNEEQGPGPSSDYNLDFARFFDLGAGPLQHCRKVDANIAKPLFKLPFIHAGQDAPESLPERNMRRARVLGLPAGQDVA